jgi:hypothetical protein
LPGGKFHFDIIISLRQIAEASRARLASPSEFLTDPKKVREKEQFMKPSNFGRAFFTILAVCLFATFSAYAQTGTTSLRGTVTDRTGASVGEAKVSLDNLGQAFHREAQTSTTGEYEFRALPPGIYALMIEKAGFRKFEQKNLQLLVNSPATANATLEVGSTSQIIEVSAQAVALNTTDASLGNAFDENQVKQLPLEGRNVPDLLSLQAGVVYIGNRPDINTDVDTRSGAVNGARSDQSTITLDGINVNDSGGHAFTSVLPVTLDSVQEFRVTTTNYNADQGGSSGAQVALVTKSGTNDFHGSLYEYHRNTYTSANDFFVKSAQQTSGTPNEPPKLIRNVFGASVGGPIKKDRLYFFLNYEGTRRAEANSAVRTVPTASLRDGVIKYLCQTNPDGSLDTVTCPGNTVSGSSGASYSAIPGYRALGPANITAMDTQGIGPSTVMLNYFNGYPLPNDTTVGDGFNYSGFRFPAPIHDTKNWYIAKLDYNITRDAKHRLSWSGALANQGNPQEPFLPNTNAPAPGNLAENTFLSFNKGFVVNYSGVLTPHLVNNFRYGYLRESNAFIGDSSDQWIFFRGLSQGITRSSNFQRPQNQFSEDLSWMRGKHTLQFGVQTAFIRNPRLTTGPSFSDGVTNASWLDVAGFAGTGATFDPSAYPTLNFPAVDGSFANSYDFPLIAMLGMITEVDATYNYRKDGSILAQGAPVKRRFAADSYEFYLQDSWKIKPNFTLTYGLRYSLFSPPWETSGLQVAPSFSLGGWFQQRGKDMLQGTPSNQDPLVNFDLSGPANGGKKGFYNWDYHNFGPRLAFAWSPKGNDGLRKSLFGEGGKTSIRGGASIVYDRLGAGLLNTFDSAGSFGLSTGLTNPAGVVSADCAPRLTDLHTLPASDLCGNQLLVPAPPGKFPQTFPSTLDTGGFAIAWGLDDSIKTPYSYTLDLSVGRQLPKGFALEVSYVGRLSHRLLAQEDLAMPKDLVDPASKMDYFGAVTALAKIYRTGVDSQSFSSSMVSAKVAQYWQNMLQPLAAGDQFRIRRCTPGNAVQFTSDPVVAAYDLFCGFSLNETTALFVLDLLGIRSASGTQYFPKGGPNSFFNPQYSSLYAWRSASNANYHALQVNFRHPMSHGVQFDFNYTFSKSIDIMSDAERIGAWGGLGGQIINSWDPKAMRAVSDFDAKHQFNANWIAELPFGRGKRLAGNANRALDAVIGGWQLSGLFRMTTGFPFNVFGGFNWPTNWQLGGNAILDGPVQTGHFTVKLSDGTTAVSAFKNGPDALNSFRAPFPGESGARNQVRGDGFFGIDMGLSKRWKMPYSEKQSLQLRWEVFNITNSLRFNVQSNPPELDISSTFGNYTGLLTNPRAMQFALRYEF